MTASHAACPVTDLFHHPAAAALAATWRERFRVVERERPPSDHGGFYLWAADDHLELRGGPGGGGVWIRRSELARRAAQGSDLARACGARHRPSVLDAMAGWGVDALTLAARGCRVTLVEQHPAIAALQEDLVRRSGIHGVECRWGDGYGAVCEGHWDVVYLDPMFPERRKKALSGKRMQWLAALAELDPRPISQWLAAAAGASDRVVLKRRRRDPVTGCPQWRITGRTVRYDVYAAGPESSCSTA